jgi:hypothetical protein
MHHCIDYTIGLSVAQQLLWPTQPKRLFFLLPLSPVTFCRIFSNRVLLSTPTQRRGEQKMETVKNLLKPKPTPQQQLREWQRRLRNEGRTIDRQIRGNQTSL